MPSLTEHDLPDAPVGERLAALTDLAPFWAVARFTGRDPRIVRRAALLYKSQAARLRERETECPRPDYVKRCGHCGQPRHLQWTCPELRPERNADPDRKE